MTGAGALRPADRWTTTVNGYRLRSLRRQRGLSRAQLAVRSRISAATIARLEAGQPTAPCRTRTLARLAAALGTEPASITAVTLADSVSKQEREASGELPGSLEVTALAWCRCSWRTPRA